MLPVVLSCQVWMKHAMADGEIDGKDHFCTSSCYENIQDNYEPCEDRMNDATKTQLADAVKLSRTCTGSGAVDIFIVTQASQNAVCTGSNL